MKHKWSAQQRANYKETIRARRLGVADMAAANARDAERDKTISLSQWGSEIQRNETLEAFKQKPQQEMYVLINGHLKRYVLRTMPVYIAAEDLKP